MREELVSSESNARVVGQTSVRRPAWEAWESVGMVAWSSYYVVDLLVRTVVHMYVHAEASYSRNALTVRAWKDHRGAQRKKRWSSSSNSSPILLLRIRLFPNYARVKRQRVLIRFSSWPEFPFSVFPRSA